jgi:catecholate siderophore receptor
MLSIVPALAMLLAVIPGPPPAAPAPSDPVRLVEGLVVDVTGRVVPGATVQLSDPGQPTVETCTDQAGLFAFRAAVSGAARLSVALAGFATVTIALPSSSPVRVVLEPAPLEETVDVRGGDGRRSTATATRTDTPLREIPQAVSIVGRDAIAAAGMQNMADVVRFVPGAGMAQGEGNRDTPILRGNSSTADFFQDGLRDDVQYYRDLYNVERVEVLNGPNAAMFGRGGTGGIINRVSRSASWTRTNEVVLQGGSASDRRVAMDVGGGLTRRLAARVTGMYERSGSFATPSILPAAA